MALVSYLSQLIIKVVRESQSGYFVKVDELRSEEDVVRQVRCENG